MPSPERPFEGTVSPEVLAQISGRELLIEHLGHWLEWSLGLVDS
jgi:hypothetical protein